MKAQMSLETLKTTLRRLRPFFPDTLFRNSLTQYVQIQVSGEKLRFLAHCQGISAILEPSTIPGSDLEDGTALVPFTAFYRAIIAYRDHEELWLFTLPDRGFLVAHDLFTVIFESSYPPSADLLSFSEEQIPPERLPENSKQGFLPPTIFHGEAEARADSSQLAPLFSSVFPETEGKKILTSIQLSTGQILVSTTDNFRYRHDFSASIECQSELNVYISTLAVRILAKFLPLILRRVNIQSKNGFLILTCPFFTLFIPQIPEPDNPRKLRPMHYFYSCRVRLGDLASAIRVIQSASPSPSFLVSRTEQSWQVSVPPEYAGFAGFDLHFPCPVEPLSNNLPQHPIFEIRFDLLLPVITHFRSHEVQSVVIHFAPKALVIEAEGEGWRGKSYLLVRYLTDQVIPSTDQIPQSMPSIPKAGNQ